MVSEVYVHIIYDTNRDIFRDIFKDFMPEIERFAALVAAVEREACAKVCDDWQNSFEIDTRGWWASFLCAEAIRARGSNV